MLHLLLFLLVAEKTVIFLMFEILSRSTKLSRLIILNQAAFINFLFTLSDHKPPYSELSDEVTEKEL